MKQYQPLISEKYVLQAAKCELNETIRQRNRDAIKTFFVGTFAICSLAAVVYSMPLWLPAMTQLIESNL